MVGYARDLWFSRLQLATCFLPCGKMPQKNRPFEMSKETLNVRRLLCPMPVIRTQDKIKTMQAGEVLEVVGTDPGMLQDIPAWCRINGHRVVDSHSLGYEYTIVVEVGADG